MIEDKKLLQISCVFDDVCPITALSGKCQEKPQKSDNEEKTLLLTAQY